MEDNFIVDFFGNKIHLGDKVVYSIGTHAGLCFGEVVRLGNTGTTVDIKIIFAPYSGYWKCAKDTIGQIKKNVKVLVNHVEHDYYKNEDTSMVDTYMTGYAYCIKYDFPEDLPQYKLINSETRENYDKRTVLVNN